MITPTKIIYRAQATATGGRDGRATSSDRKLDVALSVPTEMGGLGDGTNPEQLFAAGFAACFLGALNVVSMRRKQKLPDGVNIVGDVGIGPAEKGFALDAEFRISLPGLDRALAQQLVQEADEVCPYTKAVRGNMSVKLTLV